MNNHSTRTNKKEVANISAKVRTTKKEIEELKGELQMLLNLGTQPSPMKVATVSSEFKSADPNQPSTSRNVPEPPALEIKKSVLNSLQKRPPEPTKKFQCDRDTATCKKSKKYNQTETREYIKKQKEKRAEQLKAQINIADNKIDLKKQKLRELHQKASELVSKNVQLKRGRSKSRDKATPIRLDMKLHENRTQSRPISSLKSQEQAKKARAKSQEPPQNPDATAEHASRSRARSRPPEPANVSREPEKLDGNFLCPPTVVPELNTNEFDKTMYLHADQVDFNARISPAQKKQFLEHAILTDACCKDTKETQTTRENDFLEAAFMQAHSTLPCPYNFINTVKRKLHYATSSPKSHVDVGIQNSGGHLNGGTPREGRAKTKSEIRDLLFKSGRTELHSFVSHRAPNLDLQSVENLELVPPNSNHFKTKSQQNMFHDYEGSESDTSKNIPEISSESFGGATADSRLQLNLDKLKELKLKKTERSQGYCYSSDFNEERSMNTKSSISVNTHNSSIKTTEHLKEATGIDQDVKNKIGDVSSLKTSHMPNASDFLYLEQQGGGDSQRTFKSLLTESQISKTFNNPSSEQLITEFSHEPSALIEPSVSLTVPQDEEISLKNKSNDEALSIATSVRSKSERAHTSSVDVLKNITIRRPTITSKDNVNEIHLKFEAEVRLLNDFSKSFKQLMDVEKAFENIKSKKEASLVTTKILQNVDTQTSVVTRTSTNTPRENQKLNFSRGSEIEENLSQAIPKSIHGSLKSLQNSTFSTDWNLSDLNETSKTNISEISKLSSSIAENVPPLNGRPGALPLNIFDQLIKDEDTRIEQLKVIIKIREQALLDRTKGELVWLEIQKKQLIETGKIEEASVLKKKQRGIILKHEQERNEMKKLRQSQKEASERRKNALRQERNLIKSQLCTDNMLSQISVKKQHERRSSGPLRVVQSCSESIYSETTISDALSVTSKSVRRSDESDVSVLVRQKETEKVSNAKKTLFMREAALQKRRKTAEELLRWHRKLLDKERKIEELEAAATSVIKRTPTDQNAPLSSRHKFTGNQLNQLWRNMTGKDDRKFTEEKMYVLSQIALERLCKSARQYSGKNKKASVKQSDLSMELGAISEAEKSAIKTASDDTSYSSLFEPESVHEIITSQQEKTKISSSISELIDNFSRIEDEISTLSRKSELGISSLAENHDKSSQSVVESNLSDTEELLTVKSDSNKLLQDDSVKEEPSVIEIIEEEERKEDHRRNETSEEEDERKQDNQESENCLKPVDFLRNSLAFSEQEETVVSQISTQETAIDTNQPPSQRQSSTSSEIEGQSSEKLSDTEKEVDTDSHSSDHQETPLIDNYENVTSDKIVTSVQDESSDVATNESKQITQICSSQDTVKESLDVALESASKIEESLNKLNEKLAPKTEENEDQESVSTAKEIESIEPSSERDVETDMSSASTETLDKTPNNKSGNQINVRKRVSEILADASGLNKGDKSPRLQDLYVTAFDVALELKEPSSEERRQLPSNILGSEAEELWRKQLAIEQEIKQLQLQQNLQQKEQLPYLFMREIPNKPPPPYTPPATQPLPQSILPTDVKEITEIASYSSKVLYKAQLNKNLDKVKFSENGFKLFSNVEVSKMCAEFVFNICKDIAREHYRQFETTSEPSWLVLVQKPLLVKNVPSNATDLERVFVRKLKNLFGFKKMNLTESIKWGRKKRDHVDEVLVLESQEEESHWTNFEKDELIVKSQITDDIMNSLLAETAAVFAKIISKKKSLQG